MPTKLDLAKRVELLEDLIIQASQVWHAWVWSGRPGECPGCTVLEEADIATHDEAWPR